MDKSWRRNLNIDWSLFILSLFSLPNCNKPLLFAETHLSASTNECFTFRWKACCETKRLCEQREIHELRITGRPTGRLVYTDIGTYSLVTGMLKKFLLTSGCKVTMLQIICIFAARIRSRCIQTFVSLPIHERDTFSSRTRINFFQC